MMLIETGSMHCLAGWMRVHTLLFPWGNAYPVLNAQTLRCQSQMAPKKVFAVCAAKDGRIPCLKGKPWMVSSMDMPVFAEEEVQQNIFGTLNALQHCSLRG